MTQEGKPGQNVHLTDLIDCPKCGYSNAIGTRYCDGCGASLAGGEPRPATGSEDKRKGRLGGLLGRKRNEA